MQLCTNLILPSYLQVSAFGKEWCWRNIGNTKWQMAAGPFTRVSPFLSDSQSSLLPFRICPSDPRPRVLCCVQSWALYKVPPPLQEALYKVRGAQGQGRIPRPVFPAVQAIRTFHLRRHTGCPWHFAKSGITNVGVKMSTSMSTSTLLSTST